jgi:Cdc6-like AAA superfamily ATPase
MTFKLDLCSNFVGPKALFDPNYIPPQILHRKKEQHSLISILTDSISDEFCLNILYQGINGIGKKAVVNKVINDLSIQNKGDVGIQKICIDCKDKDFEELIFSILTDLTNICKYKVNYNSLLNSNLSHLWNVFKLLCRKIDYNLFFIFTNVEYLKPEIFKKFLHIGKESNITSIYTVNKILQPVTFDLISEFDFKKKLNYFTYKELYSILKQRTLLALSNAVDEELIKYITDLVCEQYVPVPGKGIEILRDIYPILKNKQNFKNSELIELCQNHFDQMQIHDEFSMLNYISEEDFLNIIFLDNLSNYFISKMNYYISLEELEELYHVSCESLEYEKNFDEFHNLIRELSNIGILRPSKKALKAKNSHFFDKTINTDSYFMVISPNQLKTIIDTLFDNY